MMSGAPVLYMRGVTKSFATPRGTVRVLNAVDFTMKEGEFIAITGPSGSGKSTLLNLAALLDHPTGGRIFFSGHDVSTVNEVALSELRKTMIGMVFQKFCLLPHRSAEDNVAFRYRYVDVERGEAHRRARAALEAMGLLHLAAQPARLLSGGEMQRVAIARAVALRPKLLLADEPTGNLDRHAAHTVMEAFQQLRREGISVLLATHNESLLPYCSRHIECRDGSLKDRVS